MNVCMYVCMCVCVCGGGVQSVIYGEHLALAFPFIWMEVAWLEVVNLPYFLT